MGLSEFIDWFTNWMFGVKCRERSNWDASGDYRWFCGRCAGHPGECEDPSNRVSWTEDGVIRYKN